MNSSMNISENIKNVLEQLPEAVTLVAVSKTKSEAEIMQAYDAGHKIFGENKIQEMVSKWEVMPKDIEWHMIGHVQRNKVKYMAPFVHMIHAVDSLRLLKEIDKQAAKHGRVISCLLQIRIAAEDTKFGMTEEEALSLLGSEEIQEMKHVQIEGLMGMATFTDDQEQLQTEFRKLKSFYDANSTNYNWGQLSMGMSGDYPLAIREGSTMVRVGSAIFGARNYG